MLTLKGTSRDRPSCPSGVNRNLVDIGTGKFVRIGTSYSYTYRNKGRKTIRVRSIDKAGNTEHADDTAGRSDESDH